MGGGAGLGAVVSSDSLHRPNSPTVSETLPCDTPSPIDACPGSERTLCRSQTRTGDPSRFYHTSGLVEDERLRSQIVDRVGSCQGQRWSLEMENTERIDPRTSRRGRRDPQHTQPHAKKK